MTMTLLYGFEFMDNMSQVRIQADELRKMFIDGDPPEQLLGHADALSLRSRRLVELLPPEVSSGNLVRHLHFLCDHLRKGEPAKCRGDINDICRYDLPRLEKRYRDWFMDAQHVDEKLFEEMRPLIVERQFDSAIRKCFVLLKTRIVEAFDVPTELDGARLVSHVFAQNGSLGGVIPDQEREAMRDLLSGLYKMFRNRSYHNQVHPAWHEVEAVISMVNWVLIRLNDYSLDQAKH